MTSPLSLLVFLLGSTLSAWLRFDRGDLLAGVVALLATVAAMILTWIVAARRAPPLVLPDAVNELAGREHLTPPEEARFATALRDDHASRQLAAWQTIRRQGPLALIAPRVTLCYVWSCVVVVLLLPAQAVPARIVAWAPRSVLVLSVLAVLSLAVATPLGLRDWRRVRRSLDADAVPPVFRPDQPLP